MAPFCAIDRLNAPKDGAAIEEIRSIPGFRVTTSKTAEGRVKLRYFQEPGLHSFKANVGKSYVDNDPWLAAHEASKLERVMNFALVTLTYADEAS
ncbi:hypothetical protein [Xanthomonas sp. 3075]|uniref:hypothetical protein n=1 Tax=Xanthomonas sp. 3075 TaxID=3035315 RepID=UPI0016161384|nr:hypothetical protein [Xanthomonas sp. 3075]MBB4131420.1 hypothetical protein [Xanthomonas sp. 3075]